MLFMLFDENLKFSKELKETTRNYIIRLNGEILIDNNKNVKLVRKSKLFMIYYYYYYSISLELFNYLKIFTFNNNKYDKYVVKSNQFIRVKNLLKIYCTNLKKDTVLSKLATSI